MTLINISLDGMFERTSAVFWGVSLIGKALTLQVRSCQFKSDMLHCVSDAFTIDIITRNWLSLVERSVWDREVVSSNLAFRITKTFVTNMRN